MAAPGEPRAFFGPPRTGFTRGGMHLAVYLVPVFGASIIAFDVEAAQARGRWLPWDVPPYGGNPYETASDLAFEWCGGEVSDLRLVDALSVAASSGDWEVALVYRAALAAFPAASGGRTPVATTPGAERLGPFEPVDLDRWAAEPGGIRAAGRVPGPGLLF